MFTAKIGDIVHYVLKGTDVAEGVDVTGRHRAAIVTDVAGGDVCCLNVQLAAGVDTFADLPVIGIGFTEYSDKHTPGTWHFMGRE